MPSPYGGEQIINRQDKPPSPEESRMRLVRTTSDMTSEQGAANGAPLKKSNTLPVRRPSQRNGSHEGGPTSPSSPLSPTLRDMRDEQGSQFPLGNMKDANDIAMELSNLQALRRMSMDVSNNQDPDLLPFQNMSLMAPQGDDDEADPSRLLWVPAGVHPELAPTEFKNFLEKRVQSIKRRSGDSTLSVDGLDRSDTGSLRRKKSMLSRQIDNRGGRGADGYMDGAERLGRKQSLSQTDASDTSLDELMIDPSRAVQKLTLESRAQEAGLETIPDDRPILPAAPGTGLRRSTRTTYRKGGSIKDRHGPSVRNSGDRPSFSKRIAAKKTDEEEGGSQSSIEAPVGYGLNRIQSEPVADNFSRPNRTVRRQQTFNRESAQDSYGDSSENQDSPPRRPSEVQRGTSEDRTQAVPPVPPLPAIITEEPVAESEAQDALARPFPARSSSQQAAITQPAAQSSEVPGEPPARSSRRPNYGSAMQQSPAPTPPPTQPLPQAPSPKQPPSQQPPSQQPPSQQPPSPQQQQQQSPQSPSTPKQPAREHQSAAGQILQDVTQSPAPSPASGPTITPVLSPEEKKSEKKHKKDRSESGSSSGKGTSWKWFKSESKDKDKEAKKKEEDEGKRSKSKGSVDKTHDNVRLDVLQTSIDNVKQKGRDSVVLDRDSAENRLDDERKKESSRKAGEAKKEKDGLFANFFGGKKKGDRDSGSKKSHGQRPISPELAAYKPLVPDVDYHWTRYPILEERAIYRMAHIKLANPRRALYSQVLLSNFMYSYLAKVQAMHPQIQVPQSPQQKRLQEEERKRREQEQYLAQQQEQQRQLEQQQAQESIDRYNFEYHRGVSRPREETGSGHMPVS